MNLAFSARLRVPAALLVAVVALMPLARAGTIVGRAVDANTGSYLPGVGVRVPAVDRSAVTDSEGRYRIAGIPAGSYDLRATYLGYTDVSQSVQVQETGEVVANLTFGSEIVELDEIQVEGYREGRSRALQQKRSSTNLLDIVSSDSVGSLPDRNVADALARLPGINVDVEGGEGRWVTIRGIEPTLNNVTLNGATMATPDIDGRGGRAMPLDIVGSSQVSQVEVVKAVTPDMDGNALGGTINIKTGSAFDREGRTFYGSIEAGENSAADGTLYGAEVTFADRFGADKKFGLSASVHYSHRPYSNDELQADFNDFNDRLFMETWEVHEREGERDRLGVNLNLEFRPEEGTEFHLRGLFNTLDEVEYQQQLVIAARRDPVFVTDTSVTFNRMRYDRRGYEEETEQTLINLTGGGSKRFGNLTVKGDITYSQAKETNPVSRSAQYRTGNVNTTNPLYALDWTNFLPVYDQDLASTNPAIYPVRRFNDETRDIKEDTWSPRLDFRWDLESFIGGNPGFVQTGIKYTDRDRFVDRESSRPISSATLATVGAAGPSVLSYDDKYKTGITIDTAKSFEFYRANPGLFTFNEFEEAENEVQDDYDITEKITALYAMAQVDLSERFSILGGLRYENTDATVSGFELRTDEDDNIIGVFEETSDFKYDNYLPNLQLKFNLNERSLIRFAVTGTIGRPRYEDAAPQSFLVYDLVEEPDDPAFPYGGSLDRGNPELEPYEAINLDLSFEHYLPSGGLLAVALFHKEIDNPIYTYRSVRENEIYNDIAFEQLDLTSRLNADSGSVTGVEFNAQIPFSTFVTGFLDGFGIDANASFISSEAKLNEDPDNPRELDVPFFRQPDTIYNLGLYYQKYRISARVAYNYQSESIREIGDAAVYDIYRLERGQLDLQLGYKLSEAYRLFVNWQNVTDEATEESFGPERALMRRSELFGSNIRAGVRFNF